MQTKQDGFTGAAVRLFKAEKALVLAGLLGFALAALCAVWVLLYGGPVGPDGDVSKAFSFNAAIGIFLLSTAMILPSSGLGRKGKTTFRTVYVLLALFSYFAETTQNFRGANPRFLKDGASAYDIAIGAVFGLVALLLVVFYLFLAARYFFPKVYKQNPVWVLSIRYAMIAVMLSFAAGIWISMHQGRYVGSHGNLIWLHGLGFHGLQALPFVAWLTGRAAMDVPARRALVHLSGAAYALGLVAIGWQTMLGQAVLSWSYLTFAAAGCFLLALVPVALILLRRPVRRPEAASFRS
ncbi:hypothetical protein [Cohnella sp. REN36]|uniref:hypothetical protein n=1 Tax=Cohnella sp. REN36 TaxID=2887347 RepID=UPI001D14E68C|nr:hypothetical protein [Cohnella sp. REN36]MCC3375032.1 hypothetical protein [Cohnella sp. REN36]